MAGQPNQAINNNSPSNNYFALLPYTKDTDSFDYKMDWNKGDKDRISGRFSYARPVVFQAPIFGAEAGGFAQGAFQGTSVQKTYSVGLNYDRVISPTLVAEFRAGVAHYHNDALASDYGVNENTLLGIPGANIDQWTSGIASITINGGFSTPIVGYSASLPCGAVQEVNADLANTWTKTLAATTPSNSRRLSPHPRRPFTDPDCQSARPVQLRCQPDFALNPGAGVELEAKTGPANSMASFLLDVPSFAGRGLAAGYFLAIRGNELFLFVQDKWQVSPPS